MVQLRATTQPVQPRPIAQPIVPQASKVVRTPTATVSGTKVMIFESLNLTGILILQKEKFHTCSSSSFSSSV